MSASASAPDPTSSAPHRPSLSRAAVVEAAIHVMDEEGTQHLTMRRVGRELGVEAMSLYHYVNGREDLLEAAVSHLVDEIQVLPADGSLDDVGWQGFLQELAHAVRRLALAHPQIFPLVATRHPAAPWLRPPLRNLAVVETFLDGLVARGFSDDQAVTAYRAFSSFLLGHLLLEVSALGVPASPVELPLDEGRAALGGRDQELDVEAFPTIARLQPRLSDDQTETEFEQSLEALLDRLDLAFSQ